jgi:hypothetical protein
VRRGRSPGKNRKKGTSMTRFLLTTVAVLGLMTGIAAAQSTSSQSTTTTTIAPPALVAPPAGTLSSTTTTKAVGSDGTQTDSTRSTYRNANGVAEDSTTKTTTMPGPGVTTTTETTTKVTQ